jgi:hypothetical protein
MSSKRRRFGKPTNSPPADEPWVWHPASLIASPAWRAQSINCRRLIDFLEIEHMHHGGMDNGRLLAPFNQLQASGIGRRLIAPAVREAERLGLVRVERGGKKGRQVTAVSRYTLTSLWSRTKSGDMWIWHEPTNDWKNYRSQE